MKTRTISSADFLSGKAAHDACIEHQRIERHNYKAAWVEGKGIVVTDADGNEVKVNYAATSDNRTVTADIDSVGFIGGWTYPHRAQPFKALVESINRGRLVHDMNRLPRTHRFKTCPHCGREL